MRYICVLIIILLIIYLLINKQQRLLLINTSKNRIFDFISTKISVNDNKNLILLPHLELGDNIIINGIVRHYCTIYNNVILICKKNYKKQLEYMYSDLNNLLLYPIRGGYCGRD
jgi:hypothetical protein